MKGYYSIGELSDKTGLSVHTLRYYDSIGLLHPDYVDDTTGYRYYAMTSFWRAEVIQMFKTLDIPLGDLKIIIAGKDYQSIKKILSQKKKEIKVLMKKYRQITKDIDWFKDMIEEMEIDGSRKIYEVEKDEYSVIYTENKRTEREFHMTLQDISLNELQHLDSLKRKYGYILDEKIIQNNLFRRKGEYLNLYKNNYTYTEDQYIYTVPKGTYVCQKIEVKNWQADMSNIRRYLREHHLKSKFVLAEEVGVPLFDFTKFDCEIQILVS